MRKYKFFNKAVIIEMQKSLIPQKESVLQKIAMETSEHSTNCGCSVEISEEERRLAHMQLTSQTNQKDIHVFTDNEIRRIKDVIANGYRIPFRSRSSNEVLSGLYFSQARLILFIPSQ